MSPLPQVRIAGVNKFIKLSVAALVVAGIGAGLSVYWVHSSRYPSTQDAYIKAHVVSISAQVTGQVVKVHVVENQQVKAGDPLFDLDTTVYDNLVAQASAEVDDAQASMASYAQWVDAAQSGVQSATSARDTLQAQLQRMQSLFDAGDIAQSELDTAQTDVARAASELRSAQAQLADAESKLKSNRENLLASKASLGTAELQLYLSRVTAPVDGWIANLSLREGSVVAAYQPLFSMVDSSEWWLDANFKETDMARIEIGQPVTFTVDMLPGTSFDGTVESIARGSGSTFSLLPAENATGNWVKVTQRFPIRIAMDAVDPRLRVGATASVTIDTTSESQ